MPKEGFSDIELINSPLFDLIETSRRFCNFKTSIRSLMEVAKTTGSKILELNKLAESVFEEEETLYGFQELTSKITECLNDILSSFHSVNREEIAGRKLNELELLNVDLMQYMKSFSGNEDALMKLQDEIFAMIKSEDALTEEFQNFEKIVSDYFSGEIHYDQLNDYIILKKKAAFEAVRTYDDFYLSAEEWTLETALGDRLLREGASQYDESLDMILRSCEEDDDDGANAALDEVYESYMKLTGVQILAEQTKNRAKII